MYIANDSAITALYQRYAPNLFTYLLLHTQTREDAEDLLVEVFLASLERDSFTELAAEQQRLWLWRVTHNKAADYHRRSKRRPALPLHEIAETTFSDEAEAPEELVLRDETHAHLYSSIKRLPALQQQILRLRFVNGMRCAEIAALLEKREGAVRTLLSRTLNRLRSIYEKH